MEEPVWWSLSRMDTLAPPAIDETAFTNWFWTELTIYVAPQPPYTPCGADGASVYGATTLRVLSERGHPDAQRICEPPRERDNLPPRTSDPLARRRVRVPPLAPPQR